MNAGGPRTLEVLRDLKLKPIRADLPPPLRWEAEVWQWFWRMAIPSPDTGLMRVSGRDWLALADRLGWCPDTAFGLLTVIQGALAKRKPAEPAHD